MAVFQKHPDYAGHSLELEAAELAWLAEAESEGGAPVVKVISVTPKLLELELLTDVSTTAEAAREFGRRLAHTHAAGADFFGQGPPWWGESGTYGRSRQRFDVEDNGLTWGAWFARDRIAPMIGRARDNGSVDAHGVVALERVVARLEAGEFDAPQPALVSATAARIHGDLWCGNVVWATNQRVRELTGERITGVLIDPMAHGGHAETDLAHLGVFGQPYLAQIYEGYQEVSPLAPGWQERRGLAVLQMIVMHAAIFGGSYGPQAVRLARPYC